MANARGPDTRHHRRVRARSALAARAAATATATATAPTAGAATAAPVTPATPATPAPAAEAAVETSSASLSSLESLGRAQAAFGPSAAGPSAAKPRVLIPDEALAVRAREAAAGIDFPALSSAGALRSSWRHRARAGAFTTYSREVELEPAREDLGLEADDGMYDHPLAGRGQHRRRTRQQPSQQQRGRAARGVRAFEVLAVGELAVGLEELAHALRSPTDMAFNAAMSGVHRKDFIYGSVVHVVPVGGEQSERERELSRLSAEPEALASVKTSAFVRSSVFGQNEQWCFLELFRRARFSRSLFVTASSLPARVLNMGKAQHGRVDHLHGLTTGYWAEELPAAGRPTVRVVFFGRFSPDTVLRDEELGDGGAYAPPGAVRRRLQRLARATGHLEDVVRRRRLGAQTLADRAAFDPRNSRCICCTKSLGLLAAKKRCYLCGYAVCDNCWTIQSMETRAGQVSTLRICARCLELVDAGDYSQVAPESLGPVQIVPDAETSASADASADANADGETDAERVRAASSASKEPLSASQSSSKAPSAARKNTLSSQVPPPPPSRKATLDVDEVPVMLSDLLQDALKDEYYASRKQSVMTVMQQLLDEERADSGARAKALSAAAPTAAGSSKPRPRSGGPSASSLASSSASTSSTASARRTTTPDEDAAALEEVVRGKSLPLEACVHAGGSAAAARGRQYALAPRGVAPEPANEAQRLKAIARGELMQRGGSATLDALCKLAAREMGCSTSVLTIVGQQEQRVLAASDAGMKDARLPRSETFCQHTVMGEAPLLVPHPEADVRFQNIAARTQGGRDFRFYCGFPIRGDNDAVVGAICVLDERSHDVSQAQFSAMQRLAKTASSLVAQPADRSRPARAFDGGGAD